MTIRVKVIPRAARSEIIGQMPDGTWKIRIAAAPEQGKANHELVDLLARRFDVPREAIEIVSGHGSPRKLVRIAK